mgnify:CR=1 FL=1
MFTFALSHTYTIFLRASIIDLVHHILTHSPFLHCFFHTGAAGCEAGHHRSRCMGCTGSFSEHARPPKVRDHVPLVRACVSMHRPPKVCGSIFASKGMLIMILILKIGIDHFAPPLSAQGLMLPTLRVTHHLFCHWNCAHICT